MFVTCSSLNVCVLFCDTQSSEAVFFGLRIRSLCHLLLTWVVGRWKRASEVEMMYFHRLRLREPISFVFSDECGKHSQFHKPSPIEVDLFFWLLALPHYLVNGIFFIDQRHGDIGEIPGWCETTWYDVNLFRENHQTWPFVKRPIAWASSHGYGPGKDLCIQFVYSLYTVCIIYIYMFVYAVVCYCCIDMVPFVV